ncbi:hypothetical protein V9T40_009683 [Parthenolecanium corni]|uniref:Mediator of RNA polymerase II transcription subunit 15 n=1 Tax=Parthenolecanium corni TaxID=536013 RepID=A0AAN9TNZ2_9HEMI
MNSQDENGWRTPAFRQNVVSKIEEAIQSSGMPTIRSSIDMENTVFFKSKSRDDYLGYVARLILHIRDSMSKKLNGSDPMNALRAMTQPGVSNPMMNLPQQNVQQNMTASNLLQTLNQGRSTMQNRMPGIQPSGMNQVSGPMGPIQSNPMLNRAINQLPMNNQMNQNVNTQIPNNMPGPNSVVNQSSVGGSMMVPNLNNQIGMPNQMPNQMSGAIGNQMGLMSNQLGPGQLPPPMMGNMQQPHPPMNVHLSNQRKMVNDNMLISNQSGMSFMPTRVPVQSPFLRQSTPPPNVSPVPMSSLNSMNNAIPSPVMVPSPNNTLQVPSSSGLVSVMRQAGSAPVPSPTGSVTLNTPGNPLQMTPSPLSADEQAYRDKIKQLSKYIEPLRRMISRFGNGDHENVIKMKKLLEVLSSTGQRSSLEVLLRCEAVLEKMDLKGMSEMKEQHPLVEAISVTLQSANPNHTFHRTFESVMATLNGKPLKSLPRPLKRKYVEEPTQDIPEALQGEVARLDQRFKVSLDPVHQKSSKCVYLLCWLDDRHLPCIPPVQITIPEDYPNSSPKCNLSNYEYGATKFLQMIQKALQLRISKLPSKYTMSQLLDIWENSVRETCSPERVSNLDSVFLIS